MWCKWRKAEDERRIGITNSPLCLWSECNHYAYQITAYLHIVEHACYCLVHPYNHIRYHNKPFLVHWITSSITLWHYFEPRFFTLNKAWNNELNIQYYLVSLIYPHPMTSSLKSLFSIIYTYWIFQWWCHLVWIYQTCKVILYILFIASRQPLGCTIASVIYNKI